MFSYVLSWKFYSFRFSIYIYDALRTRMDSISHEECIE